ncbi:hypothetical protein VRK_27680 [Vibrio sp. MEBiC08052]|nr:hypothetical protein VRK_27680 [Vibrio sp. MEBiC08052]
MIVLMHFSLLSMIQYDGINQGMLVFWLYFEMSIGDDF